MKKNYYSIDEDKYLIELIYENEHLNIKSIAYSAFNRFNNKRPEGSYRMRIHNAKNYLLGDGGLSNTALQQKNIIDGFLRKNSKDKLINQIKSLK